MQNDEERLAKIQKAKKRLEKSIDYIEKRFDLGFITEKELNQRRKKLIKKHASKALAEEEVILQELKQEIKRRKFGVTRWTQMCIKVLVEPDGLERIGELEQALRNLEQLLENAITRRKSSEEFIKMLKYVLNQLH